MMAKILPGKSVPALIAALLAVAVIWINPVFASGTATGVVAEVGFGSFVLEAKNGEMFTFKTGRGTAYDPEDFRPGQGDEVEVTYQEREIRGKSVQAVSKLKLVKQNPTFKKLSSPAEGVIKETGGKWLNIYIPAIKRNLRFEIVRGVKVVPKGWSPAADDNVKVTYKRVPSRLTGSYVYHIEMMEKM